MAIKLVVAVTDWDWFNHLRRLPTPSEVNFWAPSNTSFKALRAGELFLFKLHAPKDFIVGGGIFTYAHVAPLFHCLGNVRHVERRDNFSANAREDYQVPKGGPGRPKRFSNRVPHPCDAILPSRIGLDTDATQLESEYRQPEGLPYG